MRFENLPMNSKETCLSIDQVLSHFLQQTKFKNNQILMDNTVPHLKRSLSLWSLKDRIYRFWWRKQSNKRRISTQQSGPQSYRKHIQSHVNDTQPTLKELINSGALLEKFK